MMNLDVDNFFGSFVERAEFNFNQAYTCSNNNFSVDNLFIIVPQYLENKVKIFSNN